MAKEILATLGNNIDEFIMGVGTGGSFYSGLKYLHGDLYK